MPKIFVIIDGVADRPCAVLDGKTPLEAAKTPNLDFLTKNGKTGYVYPISAKVAPESDAAVTALLGYDPYQYFTGRGPLEAHGARIKIAKGDLALRCNFATIMDRKLVDRRAGRTLTSAEGAELTEALNKKVRLDYDFILKHTTEHRVVLVIRNGQSFSDNVSNVDPAYKKEKTFCVAAQLHTREGIKKCHPLDNSAKTKKTADIINDLVEQSYLILKDHPINIKRKEKLLLPANIILPRDAGIALPEFPKKTGWGAVVGMPLEKGLAKLAGMTLLAFEYPKLTGTDVYRHLYDDLAAEIKASKKHIKAGYFEKYYIHFKETDIPGHDDRPADKKKMVEILDKKFFSFIKRLVKREDCELVVTADHATPCTLKAHSSDPVPLLVWGQGQDSVERFTEHACKKGDMGRIQGKNLMKVVGF